METLSIDNIKSLPPLPAKSSEAKNAIYTVAAPNGEYLTAYDDKIQRKIWFKTQPLDIVTIERIAGIQLYAECHDQGFADDESAGNWTWIEIVILENADSTTPKSQDGVVLAWNSQYNRFLKEDFDWSVGSLFGEDHELLGQLEEGNVIAVQLCARFPGWEIYTNEGYLIIRLAEESPRTSIDYKPYVESITTIQEIFAQVNKVLEPAFYPKAGPEVFVANNFPAPGLPPLRVLSLDGGGVRGISSLHILKKIMQEYSGGKGIAKPCDVFDMIAGTSTGGLIAIMLGRLGMEIEECITRYNRIAEQIFKSSMFGKEADFAARSKFKDDPSFYDYKVLENVIKEVVQEQLKDSEAKLLDDNNKCKVFVMAVREDADNNRGPVFLRSYTNQNTQNRSLIPDIKIWEAGRATSAAPTYFKPLTVGGYTLVDGGLFANNPVGWLWNECIDYFGSTRESACFLSIGTGIGKNQKVGKAGLLSQKELASGLASAATNTQLAHLLFQTVINAYAPKPSHHKYWRFNIGDYLPDVDDYKDVGDLDSVKMMKDLVQRTEEYIKKQPQTEEIAQCVAALKL